MESARFQRAGTYSLTKSKWLMKQYWRVGTVRALLSLVLGMLVLGKFYSEHIPIINEWGLAGSLTLGAFLILFFLGVGWLYDVKARLWTESVVIQTERFPYAYVPEFRNFATDYPIVYALITTLKDVFLKLNIEIQSLDGLAEYLDEFYNRRPDNRDDFFNSSSDADRFLVEHPFSKKDTQAQQTGIPLGTRAKRTFQIWMLRLNYIQSFSGLGQDVLVFAAIYVAIIFPTVAEEGLVPIEYLWAGILFMSIPLFLILIAGGWVYDRKLKLWSPDQVVQVERSPYSYVPEPRTYSLTYPVFYETLQTLYDLFCVIDIKTEKFVTVIEYLGEYLDLRVSRDEDIVRAKVLRANLGELFKFEERTKVS